MARVTSRRRARRQPAGPVQPPWRRLRNPYKPIEVLSADQIEAIHEASLRVLEELGIDIWSDVALEVLARAGADVDREGRHVRLDRGLVAESIAHAPAESTLTPRNPARAITMGGDHVNFGLVGGPAHSTDLDRGRRSGVFAEVGPGGHFFGAKHTLARYETAFYAPLVSDWRNFETWEESGGLSATERANAIWKQMLAEYEPPPLDAAINDELDAFVARRKAEGGAEE